VLVVYALGDDERASHEIGAVSVAHAYEPQLVDQTSERFL